MDPFLFQVEEVLIAAQEKFFELIHDHAAKDSLDSVELRSFWQQMKYMYPLISEEALKLLIPFLATYR